MEGTDTHRPTHKQTIIVISRASPQFLGLGKQSIKVQDKLYFIVCELYKVVPSIADPSGCNSNNGHNPTLVVVYKGTVEVFWNPCSHRIPREEFTCKGMVHLHEAWDTYPCWGYVMISMSSYKMQSPTPVSTLH